MAVSLKNKVLLVEDDTAIRNMLEEKFSKDNFIVLVAGNGEEGLKISVKERPDIIVLDVIMPKMNGLEMLSSLRKYSWGKTVPVLLLSNDDDPVHIRETLMNNASDYLIKSDWSIEDIIKRVHIILGM